VEEQRPNWDQTFFAVADVWSRRATCPRLQTGAVIVNADNHIITSGYNGAVRGQPHCADVGCLMVAGHCERTVHAEMNALLQATRVGVSVKGCALYTLHFPCRRCLLLAVQAGISSIVYHNEYPELYGWMDQAKLDVAYWDRQEKLEICETSDVLIRKG
jgi:dCMP deaminase